ncbi:MAG: hypothetical protein AB2540_13445 [Candidatus Thiodiazotropha endolucinida]
MKKIPKQSKRLLFNHYLWNKRINQKYMPHAGYMGNGGDIHLLLGVNGTGINHLTQLLSQSLPNSLFIHNPLPKFEPKLTLSNHDDRLAIPYRKELTADHPLNRVYRIYAENNLADANYNLLLMENKKTPRILLIMKETHGLLATEALLRELQCHALFYISDPVILAEQIFSREGLNTPYLDLESEAVLESRFLKRFLSHDLRAILHAYKLIQRLSSRRQRRVQMKIFTIALIQHMFRMLAARYPELASVVDFDCIENDPKRMQFPLVNWLGANSLERSERIISTATFKPDGQMSRRWTRSWPETVNAFEVLSSKDVSLAYQILIDHELMRDEGKHKTWDERVAV